ncbi:MAG: hypothetical protein ABS52_10825 [Gemmatimonadetes bacterium SCN 70-22]|nr:MAG: hypothetical protein ABS52_10825 [Gemmatimonadetes bacterium SCN 70-22]
MNGFSVPLASASPMSAREITCRPVRPAAIADRNASFCAPTSDGRCVSSQTSRATLATNGDGCGMTDGMALVGGDLR